MAELIDALLRWMVGLPELLIYLVIGAFAALENVVPPVPADVIALFGGFLAGRGAASPWMAFLVVWLANVAGALFVYWVGTTYGARFFATRWGGFLLRPRQIAVLDDLYQKHGVKVIFLSRFFPMLRAVVPVFAGMSRLGIRKTALPVALASAIWYGVIVYLGATAGRNWEEIRAGLDAAGRWLYVAALVLVAGIAWWWWRTRRDESPRED